MTLQEAIKARHSVRQYLDKPMDLGIVMCHFEIGAGKQNFEWKK